MLGAIFKLVVIVERRTPPYAGDLFAPAAVLRRLSSSERAPSPVPRKENGSDEPSKPPLAIPGPDDDGPGPAAEKAASARLSKPGAGIPLLGANCAPIGVAYG